jgi:aspartate/methionine/tyrosine aminotransferase
VGARLCGAEPVVYDDPTELDPAGLKLIWLNSPSNPTGRVLSKDELTRIVAWAREHDVLVFSDECYLELGWEAEPVSVLHPDVCGGTYEGVVAVHSLSKRSNLAGLRVGFYAGDAELVGYLQEVRKHVGLLVPGPAQAAGVVALDDDEHVEAQRQRYRERLELMAGALSKWAGLDIDLPAGGFYLWFPAGDGWDFTERVARAGGALVSPGEFYGTEGADHVRVAVVQPLDRLNLVVERLGVT